MLGSLVILDLLGVTIFPYMSLPGENDSSRGNQQERLRTIGWIVGFVDGEGCFSVSIFKNRTTKSGWQVLPEFVVTQGAKSLSALKEIKDFFGCGRLFINRRYDNHKEHLYRYCVRNRKDLREKIIPFFEANPLKTTKKKHFEKFKLAIELMDKQIHLSKKGIERFRRLIKS